MSPGAASDAPVVAGIDGSEYALRAARWAASAAAHRRAPLLLVHAMGIPDLYAGPQLPAERLLRVIQEQGMAALAAATEAARQIAEITVETRLEPGSPALVLRDASRSTRMLVLGMKGAGHTYRLTLGSIPAKLAAHAHCPVVVIRGEDADRRPERDPVVVGVDGSPLSERALAHGFEEADLRGAPLIAVHTWSDGDLAGSFGGQRPVFDWRPHAEAEEAALGERLAGWGEKYPDVPVERVVRRDHPRSTLIDLSERAQLVVVGSRGRGGFTGLLLGSTSQALIHHAACPVMVVRPETTGRYWSRTS